jgi:phosphoglycolate phosphatase
MAPSSPSPPSLCIFDLDGTLVDSLRDIADALNDCLELLGLPTHPAQRYRYMVGEGVPRLCQRAIGRSHPHLVGRLIELARPRYRTRFLEHTRPYPGVRELVRALYQRGMRLGVLSNKPHEMSQRVVRHFWPDDEFARVQGYIEENRRKPDPTYLSAICRALDVPPESACLIGDTPTDVETARNAGTQMVGVTWGFRSRADLEAAGAARIVDEPQQVLAALGL